MTLSSLATLLVDHGRPADGEALAREALAICRRSLPQGHLLTATTLAALGSVLTRLGGAVEADPLLRECLSIRERALPDGHAQVWCRHNAMSLLGGALTGRGKFSEAEPLLIEGYEKFQPPRPWGSRRKREAMERVVKLYEAWDTAEPGKGYDAKAGVWRAKLAKFDEATQPTAIAPAPAESPPDAEISGVRPASSAEHAKEGRAP
jgi:hypothetical protein